MWSEATTETTWTFVVQLRLGSVNDMEVEEASCTRVASLSFVPTGKKIWVDGVGVIKVGVGDGVVSEVRSFVFVGSGFVVLTITAILGVTVIFELPSELD